MFKWLEILFGTARTAIRCRHALALENLALRQQLAVLKCQRPGPALTDAERHFRVLLSRIWSGWRAFLANHSKESIGLDFFTVPTA
jgi:hypothetical protein